MLPQLQHVIDLVARAADRGDAAVEIGLQLALARLLRVEFRPVVVETARAAEMHMHVDQARQHGLARGVDRLGVERFRVGKVAVVDLRDLARL